jgi:hypothetical protein
MKLNPYLAFDGHGREASEFYETAPDGKIAFTRTVIERWRGATGSPPDDCVQP